MATQTISKQDIWAYRQFPRGSKLFEQDRERAIERYQHLVNITAGKIVPNLPPNMDREDLVGAGLVGLIKAVDQFDTERGIKFETYAIALIRGAILESLREYDWMPRSISDKAKRIKRATSKLKEELGREPTYDEIAEAMGIDVNNLISWLSEISYRLPISLDELLIGGEGNETGVTLAETMAGKTDVSQRAEAEEKMRLLAEAIDRLPPREHRVIDLYYNEDLTFREIGRVLEISESRAYQLHTQAIMRLQRSLRRDKEVFIGFEDESRSNGHGAGIPAEVVSSERPIKVPLISSPITSVPPPAARVECPHELRKVNGNGRRTANFERVPFGTKTEFPKPESEPLDLIRSPELIEEPDAIENTSPTTEILEYKKAVRTTKPPILLVVKKGFPINYELIRNAAFEAVSRIK